MKPLHVLTAITLAFAELNAAPNGLVGHWPLNEGEGKIVRDISGNNLHGAVEQPLWDWDDSRKNTALELRANKKSSVTVPFKPALNITGELTIESWVYPTTLATAEIVSKGRCHWSCGYQLFQQNGKIALWVATENRLPKDRPIAYAVTSDQDVLREKTWSHVACTYSAAANKVALYHNGKKIKEAPADGKITHYLYPSMRLCFGADAMAGGYYRYSGLLRNVKIYNRALDEKEIHDSFQENRSLAESGIALFADTLAKISTSTLKVSTLDADTGRPMGCRVSVKGSNGVYLCPENGRLSQFFADDWECFHTPGSFDMKVPPGETKLIVTRGFEYEAKEVSVTLASNESRELPVKLRRLQRLPAEGWHAGDPHLHYIHYYGEQGMGERSHLAAATEICKAEGLSYAAFQCGVKDHPQLPSTAGEDFIACLGYEFRNDAAAHFTWLNPHSTRLLTSTRDFDCLAQIDEAAADGGILYYNDIATLSKDITNVSAHGYCRELPITAALGKMPVAEIFCAGISSADPIIKEWYRYLNLGFKLAAAASTDGGVFGGITAHPFTPGFFRTYVHCPELSWPAIVKGFRNGRLFVTNGPLIRLAANGREIGETVTLDGKQSAKLNCEIKASACLGIEKVEIVKNGEVIKTIVPDPGKDNINTRFEMDIRETCWLAARACGKSRKEIFPWAARQTFAHTSPIYVQFGDLGMKANQADVDYFLRWLDQCREFAPKWAAVNKRDASDPSLRRYMDLLEKARTIYASLPSKPRTWLAADAQNR
ncbi:MAG: CehA/McbA family metallohydrolase [Verrucomicrobiae bacterium]|nr:CehA/McbA family metallohydrolase [Verrucomicrobiae bacterium]